MNAEIQTMLTCARCGAQIPKQETVIGKSRQLDKYSCICDTCLASPEAVRSKSNTAPTLVTFLAYLMAISGALIVIANIPYLTAAPTLGSIVTVAAYSGIQIGLACLLLFGFRIAYFLFIIYLLLSVINDSMVITQAENLHVALTKVAWAVLPLCYFLFCAPIRDYFFKKEKNSQHAHRGDAS